MIRAVDRKHHLLADFRPMPARATEGGAEAEAAGGPSASAAASVASTTTVSAAVGGGAGVPLPELYIEELWRAGKELRGVMEALAIPGDAMFMEKEVRHPGACLI